MSSETMRNNTTELEEVLAMVNNLPDAGVGDLNAINPDLNVLVLGDSLFGGGTGRDFLNGLGCNIENLAVVGASFSEIPENLNADGSFKSIGSQMYNYSAKVGTYAFTEPDVILMDGGGNDYILGATIGNLVSNRDNLSLNRPTHYLDGGVNPSMFDFTTVMGGLEKALHYASYYPNAQKYFLIMHRVNQTGKFTFADGLTHRYWATDTCSGGYNYDTLRENIVKACQLYGFKIIDIYNDSCLNMIPMQVVEPTAQDGYWYINGVDTGVSSSITLSNGKIKCANLKYFDWKGIHPTMDGYKIGYENLIKDALRLATKK